MTLPSADQATIINFLSKRNVVIRVNVKYAVSLNPKTGFRQPWTVSSVSMKNARFKKRKKGLVRPVTPSGQS